MLRPHLQDLLLSRSRNELRTFEFRACKSRIRHVHPPFVIRFLSF